jgi:hypothetical protein
MAPQVRLGLNLFVLLTLMTAASNYLFLFLLVLWVLIRARSSNTNISTFFPDAMKHLIWLEWVSARSRDSP